MSQMSYFILMEKLNKLKELDRFKKGEPSVKGLTTFRLTSKLERSIELFSEVEAKSFRTLQFLNLRLRVIGV